MTRRRQASERGAAVFIVVMVIALLTAVGVWSAHAASQVNVATGYNRQAVQTFYVGEYATRTIIADLGVPGIGTNILGIANSSKAEACQVTRNVVPPIAGNPVPCYRMYRKDVAPRIVSNFPGQVMFNDATVLSGGSLGPMLLNASEPWTVAWFEVQMSDFGPPPEPEPGFDVSGGSIRSRQFTLTGTGRTLPFIGAPPAPDACDERFAPSAGSVQIRAIVSVPGFPMG